MTAIRLTCSILKSDRMNESILTPLDIFLNSYLTSIAPSSKMLKIATLSRITVKEHWLKTAQSWFRTLHPFVQAVLVICSFVFVIVLIFNHEASTNFLNILPWFLALLGSKKIQRSSLSSIRKTKTKSKSGSSNEKE